MAQMLYRKWRPKRLVDVVGQEHITRTLSNAVKLDRIAHAFFVDQKVLVKLVLLEYLLIW